MGWFVKLVIVESTVFAALKPFLRFLRIPGDADRRSGSCRSAVPLDGDQRSRMMPITDSGMIAIS
jgi:hypothetical protein